MSHSDRSAKIAIKRCVTNKILKLFNGFLRVQNNLTCTKVVDTI